MLVFDRDVVPVYGTRKAACGDSTQEIWSSRCWLLEGPITISRNTRRPVPVFTARLFWPPAAAAGFYTNLTGGLLWHRRHSRGNFFFRGSVNN